MILLARINVQITRMILQKFADLPRGYHSVHNVLEENRSTKPMPVIRNAHTPTDSSAFLQDLTDGDAPAGKQNFQ